MADRGALSPDEVKQRMTSLDDGWEVREGELRKQFEFESFPAAFGWMTSVAIHAQQMDHHPDWSNSYRKVMVALVSHDVGGLSERDFRLAAVMDGLAAGRATG